MDAFCFVLSNNYLSCIQNREHFLRQQGQLSCFPGSSTALRLLGVRGPGSRPRCGRTEVQNLLPASLLEDFSLFLLTITISWFPGQERLLLLFSSVPLPLLSALRAVPRVSGLKQSCTYVGFLFGAWARHPILPASVHFHSERDGTEPLPEVECDSI